MSRRTKSGGCSPSIHRNYVHTRDGFAAYSGKRKRQWFSFTPSNLPSWACCYAVYINGALVYIGQTENLLARFRAHVAKSKWLSGEITIKAKLSRRFGDWAMTEIRLIKRLQPLFNRRGILNREDVFV
jgi:hypothetical protein